MTDFLVNTALPGEGNSIGTSGSGCVLPDTNIANSLISLGIVDQKVLRVMTSLNLHHIEELMNINLSTGDGDGGAINFDGANLKEQHSILSTAVIDHILANLQFQKITVRIFKDINRILNVHTGNSIDTLNIGDVHYGRCINRKVCVIVFIQIQDTFFTVLLNTPIHGHGKQFLHFLGIHRRFIFSAKG